MTFPFPPRGLDRLHEFCQTYRPRIALILGSGWGELTRRCQVDLELSYLEIPEFGAPTVPGHCGKVVLGQWADQPIILFSGRLHFYEGHPWRKVLQPVHIAHYLGADILVLTNAAGGIRPDLRAGSLMALTGHLSWVGPKAWKSLADGEAASLADSPYCPQLRHELLQSAVAVGVSMTHGVYAQVSGPCYETPAEVRALRAGGADAVGMSTGKESEAAQALGMRCVALSCITNAAAGLADGPIHHEEVTQVAGQKTEALCAVITEFVRRVGKDSSINPATDDLRATGGLSARGEQPENASPQAHLHALPLP